MQKDLALVRNIGIIAHIDAGKTTLSERILFYTDTIHRMGEVHEGAATMDFLPEEQDRGITIASACISCQWLGHSINLIDTPGHVDFTIEVERSLRVLDGAVGVFCAVAGVEPQSETVWRQAEAFHIPKIAFVNKLDRVGASLSATLDSMRQRLGINPVVLTVPDAEEQALSAVFDLVTQEHVVFPVEGQGRELCRRPMSDAEKNLTAPWREELLSAAADEDDSILECFLSGQPIEPARIRSALRTATLARRIVPVFSGSALKNIGVQPLLDGVCAYLPGPEDAAPPVAVNMSDGRETLVAADPAAPLCALVFKVLLEGGRKLALIRLYAGTMETGSACYNVSQQKHEKAGRIFRLYAHRREHVDLCGAGDIVAVQGLRSVVTGDSLATLAQPLLLEKICGYTPVISQALETHNSEENKKLDEALELLALEDPTVKVTVDEDSGQRILSGMGELHLDVLCTRLRREFALAPRVGTPHVIYHESIRKAAEATGVFERMLGGQHHHGCVVLRVTPLERDQQTFVQCDFSESDKPEALVRAALDGVHDAVLCGSLGYEVRNVAFHLSDLGIKNGVSTVPGVRMAAAAAVKEALQAGQPVLLEPVMRIKISVPESMVGSVVSLLNSRSGKVEEMHDEHGVMAIQGIAPMRELFGFSTVLRSATQGRGGFTLSFLRFDAV